MRILHIDTEKGWRGGEQQLLYLIKGLRSYGIESVVACREGEKLELNCKKEKFKTVVLSGRQIKDIFTIASIAKDFDLIHAHAAKAHTIAVFSKEFHKRKIVYTRRVDYIPKSGFLTKLKYKKTDKIVAISRYVREVLVKFLNTKADDEIPVVYSSVDLAVEKRINLEKVKKIKIELGGAPLIGTVAALTSQKNIPNFVKSAKILLEKYKNAKFVVLGEGKKRREIENLIKNLGLKRKVLLLGFKEDVENYIKALDVFVLSSDFEGLGSSILTSMLLKVPVVSTDAGATKEIVVSGKTGELVPKGDPIALASGISKVLEDKSLRNSYVTNAYEMVRRQFSADRMVANYVEIYKSLL